MICIDFAMNSFNQEGDILNVRSAAQRLGPASAFTELIAANNALIRSPDLDIGRRIGRERTAIYTQLVRVWEEEQQTQFGYDKPFAVVALGGTGRGEMTPYSDTDFAFLFDEALEGSAFLLELQRQVLHTDSFEQQYGFQCEALPFSLDDVPILEGKQLNSFLDMRAVYDPDGLTEVFLERIRSTYNPFDHFLHVREFWREQWEVASLKSEDFDRFDIKNDGLRVFLAGIWTLGGNEFRHSHEIYETLEDKRDLEAYELLLRIRAFVHSQYEGSRRPGNAGNHPEDIMTFDDFTSFGRMLGPEASREARFEFGNEVRSRMFAARRRIAIFTRSVIRQELKRTRKVSRTSPIVYGLGGLFLDADLQNSDRYEKSRLVLSLLLAAQRFGTPIDHMELHDGFGDAGDWLEIVPELAALFYEEKGSLADTFEFLSQVVGAEERLFPGYGKFESSLDGRIMIERQSLRGKLQREKFRALEGFLERGRAMLEDGNCLSRYRDPKSEINIAVEAALLDPDHIAAIKLALKTKRLPLTAWDQTRRADDSYPLHERFHSGFSEIPLKEYYTPFLEQGGFSRTVIELVEFLIEQRSVFVRTTLAGPNDKQQVQEFANLCGSEERLRALFVFYSADHVEWDSEKKIPARWFSIRELYTKTLLYFRPVSDSSRYLAASGYSIEEQEVLKDFGQDFYDGMYRHYANRFGPHLLRLADDPTCDICKYAVSRDGASTVLGVAARDVPGLAALITGLLWQQEISLRQSHLFSSMKHKLAMDFFHLESIGETFPQNLAKWIEERIHEGSDIEQIVGAPPPAIGGKVTLTEWRPTQFCLRYEGDQHAEGLIYALTFKLFRHLQADIFGMTAYKTRTGPFVSLYFNLPTTLSLEEGKILVDQHFA